jgi:hypothetical protein
LVREGIVATKGGASKLIHRFEELGVIWSPGSMPALGKGDGTRLFLPGSRPIGPEPKCGNRVRSQLALDGLLDGVPGAVSGQARSRSKLSTSRPASPLSHLWNRQMSPA